MGETVRRIGENRDLEVARDCLDNEAVASVPRRNICPEDGAVLVRDGMRVKLLDFKQTSTAACPLVTDVEGLPQEGLLDPLRPSHPSACVDLFLQLGDQGALSFITLIEEEVSKLQLTPCSPI